jgi:hypothetical protein
LTDQQIRDQTWFQEQFFDARVVRAGNLHDIYSREGF